MSLRGRIPEGRASRTRRVALSRLRTGGLTATASASSTGSARRPHVPARSRRPCVGERLGAVNASRRSGGSSLISVWPLLGRLFESKGAGRLAVLTRRQGPPRLDDVAAELILEIDAQVEFRLCHAHRGARREEVTTAFRWGRPDLNAAPGGRDPGVSRRGAHRLGQTGQCSSQSRPRSAGQRRGCRLGQKKKAGHEAFPPALLARWEEGPSSTRTHQGSAQKLSSTTSATPSGGRPLKRGR
jgi:hypothetical protein